MRNLNKQYASSLKKLQGAELTEELTGITTEMENNLQRTRDRGSYLVLEHINRVPEEDQENLIGSILKANPYPSRGVKSSLSSWAPKTIPSFEVAIALIQITGCDFVNHLATQKTQQKDEMSKSLAPKLANELILKSLRLLQKQKEQRGVDLHGIVAIFRYLTSSVALSVEFGITATLTNLHELNLLHKYIDPAQLIPAVVKLNNLELQEIAIKQAIKSITTRDIHCAVIEATFELVKQDRFSKYRDELFQAVYTGWIHPVFYNERNLILAAEMARYFKNNAWEEQLRDAGKYDHHIRRYGEQKYWTIQPDGSFQDPVPHLSKYSKELTEQALKAVSSEALLLSFSQSRFREKQLSVNSYTKEQLTTVYHIIDTKNNERQKEEERLRQLEEERKAEAKKIRYKENREAALRREKRKQDQDELAKREALLFTEKHKRPSGKQQLSKKKLKKIQTKQKSQQPITESQVSLIDKIQSLKNHFNG